jgi:hypothetical protein
VGAALDVEANGLMVPPASSTGLEVGAIAASRALDELQQLFLASCPLGDTEVTALAESEHLPALRVLDLSLTRCGRDGLDALGASALGARLVSLDLSHNGVCDRDLGALLAGRRLDRPEHLALDG